MHDVPLVGIPALNYTSNYIGKLNKFRFEKWFALKGINTQVQRILNRISRTIPATQLFSNRQCLENVKSLNGNMLAIYITKPKNRIIYDGPIVEVLTLDSSMTNNIDREVLTETNPTGAPVVTPFSLQNYVVKRAEPFEIHECNASWCKKKPRLEQL